MKEYCPIHVIALEKNRKKLGHFSTWLVCPKCGFRKRADDETTKWKDIYEYFERKRKEQKEIVDQQIKDEML